MAIDSLRDGFVRICFDPSANLVGDKCRLVLEGQYLESTETGCEVEADTLVRVTSTATIDCMFGAGSVLSESLKTAFRCCADGSVDIYAVPRAAPVDAVAAVYTVTIEGTAATDGRVDIYAGEGNYAFGARVRAGDTALDIADALLSNAPDDFPYIITSAGAGDPGVDLVVTAKNPGVVGNWLQIIPNWHNRNNYMPEGITITSVQTTEGEGSPEPLDLKAVLGECCVCCYAVLTDDEDMQQAAIDYIADAWSCDHPQCFGHAYTYNAGSLGGILAGDTNSPEISRLAHCTTDPILPYLKVAAYAATSCCLTQTHPEISIQGPQFGVLGCVTAPESCSQCLTWDEQEQLRESGFVVTVPEHNGAGEMTSPMVTNDITNGRYDAEGRENLTFQAVSSRRLAAVTANELALQLQQFQGLGYFNENTQIREGVRGTNRRIILGQIRVWVKSQIGVLFSEFDDIDADIQLQDDFTTAARCLGVPGKLHLNFVYRPPVRINQIVVNAVPKLMNNC